MAITPQDRINGTAKRQTPPLEEKQVSAENSVLSACSYIGLEDDPDTRLLYVSPAAYCHRVEPAAAVDLSHQQEYCLAARHQMCPVLMHPEWESLPAELQYHEPVSPAAKRGWLWGAAAVVVISLMLGGLFMWGNGRSPTGVDSSSGAAMPVAAAVSTQTATATIIASPTMAPTKTKPPQPTVTLKPSATATILPTATVTTLPTATPKPTLTPAPPTETAVPNVQAVVAVPFLNVRSGPGTAYDLLATIDEGDEVELTGRISDSSWWQVCCVNGGPGWVIAQAVVIPEDAETLVPRVTSIPALPTPTTAP